MLRGEGGGTGAMQGVGPCTGWLGYYSYVCTTLCLGLSNGRCATYRQTTVLLAPVLPARMRRSGPS